MENVLLKEKLASCEDYEASLEQYSHRDNLIFNGIPAIYAETATATYQRNRNGESSVTTVDKVIQFCHDELGVAVTTSDISTAHRIRMRSSDKPAPIVVKFTRRITRDEVFRAKKVLKEYNEDKADKEKAYINKDLLDDSRKLLGKTRSHVRNKRPNGCWTTGCHIYVKRRDDKVMQIKSDFDLTAALFVRFVPELNA